MLVSIIVLIRCYKYELLYEGGLTAQHRWCSVWHLCIRGVVALWGQTVSEQHGCLHRHVGCVCRSLTALFLWMPSY